MNSTSNYKKLAIVSVLSKVITVLLIWWLIDNNDLYRRSIAKIIVNHSTQLEGAKTQGFKMGFSLISALTECGYTYEAERDRFYKPVEIIPKICNYKNEIERFLLP